MRKVCAFATLLCITFSVYSQRARFEPILFIDPEQINIVRDGYGVPHIFAGTDAEAAYGLAWAHAEDDFQTIQKCFLASKSMLGQQNGREGAKVDYVVHLLRLRELVNTRYQTDISEDFKLVLNGYCDGINAYADTHPKEVLEKRSFPITPHDLIVYSLLQLSLSCDVDQALKKIYEGQIELADFDMEGSNAFALNSRKTKDGNTYLAINTHHPLEGQVSWYEAHVSSNQGWNILGGLYPGSPVIFTGVNPYLGWTHTVNHPDKIDVYQLETNPENNLQYRFDGEWYTLEENTVKLKVKVPGGNFHTKRKVYWSVYGPTLVTSRGVFSIRTAAIMDIRGLEQWYRMNKSENFSQFKSALTMQAIPAFNIVYADKYDTIYYLSNAKLPVRNPGIDWRHTVPGNSDRVLWTQFHPLQDLPQVLNPKCGYLYNTNHSAFAPTDDKENLKESDFESSMGFENHDNNRSLRVKELLASSGKITFEDFKRIKYDLQLPQKLSFPVNLDTVFLLDENAHPEFRSLIVTLKAWDRKATIDSKGAALFAILFNHVAAKYKKDPTFTVVNQEHAVDAYRFLHSYLIKYFGKTDITLGDLQRLERGEKSLPLPGLPDVLAAMYSMPDEDGKITPAVGECYISLIRFTTNGPEIESVNAFGASNRPGSKHYNDQMELFAQQKTKKMTLDRDDIYRNAERIYHPMISSKNAMSARLTRGRR
jgi:acyl-homoserine-lactone acylase